MKSLAKDCIPAGCLCIVIWTIILPSVASNGMVPAPIDLCTEVNSVELIPLSSLEGLCPGKVIMFFCQINNSTVLAWSSVEYINDLLTLTIRDNPGRMIMDPTNMDTVGTYSGSEIVNGTVVSGRSLLAIKLRAVVPNAAITCHSEDNGCSSRITFHLLDAPGAPEEVAAEEMPDSDPNDSSCKIHIQLSPPSNIDTNYISHYLVQYPSGNQTFRSTVGIVTLPECTPEVRLNISAINICGEIGASVSDIKPTFIPRSSAPRLSTSSTLYVIFLIIFFFMRS